MFLSEGLSPVWWIVIGVVVLLVIVCIAIANSLKIANVKVDEALSGIDVALEKRYDQITKLVDTVKGYAKHEAETLMNVIKMRTGNIKEASVAEKNEIESKLSDVLKQVNVVVEKYPDLKADSQFKSLMNAINDVEDHLQAARRLYNANVSSLNQQIVAFPSSLVAKMIKIEKRDFFEAEEKKREDVKINF